MKQRLSLFSAVFTLIAVFSATNASAQLDEVREVTGLPIAIGQAVIYGQVMIQNIDRNEKRPTIFVSLVISGTQVDRRSANSSGYFHFMQRARPGSTLVLEVNGVEVSRAFLAPTGNAQVRQDFTLDWRAFSGATKTPPAATISAKDAYTRSDANEAEFGKAMELIKAGKNDEAVLKFDALLANDPKDHIAWMMLGTLHLDGKKYDKAEDAFKRSITLRPDFAMALVNYGRLEITRKSYEAAIELLLKAVAADPASADANHFLGESYLQIKKGSLAVGYLNKAIELAPIAKADLHLRLATLYNGANLKDRAAEEYKMFLEKVKDHPDKKKFEQYIKENKAKS